MIQTILTIVIPLCGTVIGSVAGIMTSTRMTTYRIDQLEKKVDKHNDVIERVAIIENDEDAQWKRIDELRADVEALKKEVYQEGR